jgi:catechol 2,3-dioxygenase-like lactoylglutathione lyase family enzyme
MQSAMLVAYLALAAIPDATPTAQPPMPAPAQVSLKGTKIMVSDLQRSIAFYSSVFGLKVARSIREDPARPVNETILTQDGTFDVGSGTWLVLKVPGAGDRPFPPDRSSWGQIVVTARDGAAIAARAAKAGSRVQQFQYGIVVVSDPDGHTIEVLPAGAK